MPSEAIKVLGQVMPSAGTVTAIYTVPAGKSAVVSFLAICNQGPATTVGASVAVAGAADVTSQYVIPTTFAIGADTPLEKLGGLTLGTTDVVRVYATLATVSFTLFGTEITP